jgi:hypothetical protein
MAKLIVERPRRGGGVGYPRGRMLDGSHVAIDESRKREGIRRPWMSENLAPLRRYLQTNVGRPWDKVYSEVCERINRDSAVQLHVWQHLMMDVCTDPHVVLGLVSNRYGFFRFYRFYVDPKSGLLRENRNWRYRRPETAAKNFDRIKIDESREYRLLDGLWYELELKPLPGGVSVYDMALKAAWPHVSSDDLVKFHGRRVYAARKRQLNSKEIRRLPKLRGKGGA